MLDSSFILNLRSMLLSGIDTCACMADKKPGGNFQQLPIYIPLEGLDLPLYHLRAEQSIRGCCCRRHLLELPYLVTERAAALKYGCTFVSSAQIK
jgi:hypothetical protein